MDLIRASIKCLFYDYPLPKVLEFINDKKGERIDDFLSYFPYLVQYRERNYTLTEVQTLQSMLRDVWLKDAECALLVKPFHLLPKFSGDVLTYEAGVLHVKFENYLRWHNLSLYLGEDFLTTAYLANIEVNSGTVRTNFSWPAVLEHDKTELNAIISKGCSDVHNHLYASADVFNINWITLMNQVQESITERPQAAKEQDTIDEEYIDIINFDSPLKDPVPNFWGYKDNLTLRRLAILAALIRLLLYKTLKGQQVSDEQWKALGYMLDNTHEQAEWLQNVQNWIGQSAENKKSFFMCNDWDYVINEEVTIDDDGSAYMVLAGERWLLYNFMRRLFEKDPTVDSIAPFVYVYSLIKLIYRRELVLTNNLKGFRNFSRYQSMESLFIHAQDDRKLLASCYAIATGIRKLDTDYFETRLSLGNPLERLRTAVNGKIDYDHDVKLLDTKLLEKTSLVASASKALSPLPSNLTRQKNEDSRRYKDARNNAKKIAEGICQEVKNSKSEFKVQRPFVMGMDACGDEINARPEAFAVAYRYLKGQGFENLTYHAGEDFYDLIDGLRAIDELLLFLDYGQGNRIGHALSLGLDAKHFYESKHMTRLAPRQYVLDNLVWLLKRGQNVYGAGLEGGISNRLFSWCTEIYTLIFEDEDFDIDVYWNAYLLRANDPKLNKRESEPSSYAFYAISSNPAIPDAPGDKAETLYSLYLNDKGVRVRGEVPHEIKYQDWIIDTVVTIQKEMRAQLQEKGIMIESAPTSNLYIGQFSRYDEHPMLVMNPVEEADNQLSVSINTDDSGIMATSLYAEYSLMALALFKTGKYSEPQVFEYIDRIRENSNTQRFK